MTATVFTASVRIRNAKNVTTEIMMGLVLAKAIVMIDPIASLLSLPALTQTKCAMIQLIMIATLK